MPDRVNGTVAPTVGLCDRVVRRPRHHVPRDCREPHDSIFSLTNFPPMTSQPTVKTLPRQRLRGIEAETWKQITGLFDEIDLFDGTSMELPPTLCEWAETEPDASRMEMHLKLSGIDGRFQEAITTRPGGNGNAHFEDLLDLEKGAGRLYVFDAGYFDIDRYHEITDTGNYFVTKLHGNIEPEQVCQRPVPTGYTDVGGRTGLWVCSPGGPIRPSHRPGHVARASSR